MKLTDEWIAEKYPDCDPAEIRRRFDALMDCLGDEPWRGVPRYPEVMQKVLAARALLPAQNFDLLLQAWQNVPEHIRSMLWTAERPMFGEQRVMFVTGDDGHGMGRQAIAHAIYVKDYNLAPWIAAASPLAVGALLGELERLRQQVDHAAAIFRECSVTSGVCCCGDDMENHASPMTCGHSPTDSGEYAAYRWLEDCGK